MLQIYGSAETAGAICIPRVDDPLEIRLGAVGKPTSGQDVRIVHPKTGAICATDDVGEIQLRGSGVISSYVADAKSTQQCFLPDRWLRTRDLGSLNADGILQYLGRLADMLTIDGHSVSAMVIEACLSAHPAVALAQVVAKEDSALGEVAAAFIELRPGTRLDAADLISFCRTRMCHEHIPRYLILVHEWPISASKIQKQALARPPVGPRLL